MKTITVKLPEIAASFLINGDDSSLDEQTKKEVVSFLYENDLRLVNCLSCSDEREVGKWNGQMCMMLEYVFAVN